MNFPGSLESLSGVGRDKFERAVFDQHYAEILARVVLLIIRVTGGEPEALHEWIYLSPYMQLCS